MKNLFKILIILLLVNSCNSDEDRFKKKVNEAVGHLVIFKLRNRGDGEVTYREMFSTYEKHIKNLPVNWQAEFFFSVDNSINVHGGPYLFWFYGLVSRCCEKEFIKKIEDVKNSPHLSHYFGLDILERKLSTLKSIKKMSLSTTSYIPVENYKRLDE